VTAIAGVSDINIANCIIDSLSSITKNGAGGGTGLNIQNCQFYGGSSVVLSAGSTRALTMQRVKVNENCVITSNGLLGADSLSDGEISANSAINFTGTVSGTNAFSNFDITKSTLAVSGTTTAKLVSEVSLTSSTLTINNDTSTLNGTGYTNIRAIDGAITLQNNTVAKQIKKLHAFDATIDINNPTGAGNFDGLYARNKGTLTVNGTAAAITTASVEVGALIINGGTSTRISKSMTGSLTTGTNTHNDVYHNSPTVQSLILANSQRGRDLFTNTLI
jgi:hypothetical protein